MENENLDNSQPTPVTTPVVDSQISTNETVKPTKNKLLPILLIILALVSLAVVGLFVYQNYSVKQKNIISPKLQPVKDKCIDSNEECVGAPNGAFCTTGKWCDESGEVCGGQSCVGLGTGRCFNERCLSEIDYPIEGWKTYINPVHKYELQYPPTWKISEYKGDVNLREISDKTPAESGFTISVISIPAHMGLVDWVKQNPDNGTFLYDPSVEIKSSLIKLKGRYWEKIENDSIGCVPTGYVRYGRTREDKLFVVVNYSSDTEIIEQILGTFRDTG